MLQSVYLQNVRDILNDPSAAFYSDALLKRFINRARTKVAKDAECLRYLTPGSAAVTGFTQVSGGSGYTSPPTVTVSGPDMIQGPAFTTATGTAVLAGNSVASITLNSGGSGYVVNPTVTLSGGGGTGASFTATVGTHFTTTAGVETYTFAAATSAIAVTGVQAVIDVLDISIAYSGTKMTLINLDWMSFQAYLRSYAYGQNYPCVWSKYQQGESANFYLAPVPSGQYAIEADCMVTPIALVDDTTVDLIPDAWTEPVFYYAAYLAYQNAFRMDDSKTMQAEYMNLLRTARANSSSILIPSMYSQVF